jgi:hypothetical protein
MVRQSFALGSAEDHERLIAALLEACAFCDRPENSSYLGDLLANAHYVNAPAECVRAGLSRTIATTPAAAGQRQGFSIFHRSNANEPSDDKARWIMEQLYDLLQMDFFRAMNPGRTPVLKNVFRKDIFERAKARMQDRLKHEEENVMLLRGA